MPRPPPPAEGDHADIDDSLDRVHGHQQHKLAPAYEMAEICRHSATRDGNVRRFARGFAGLA